MADKNKRKSESQDTKEEIAAARILQKQIISVIIRESGDLTGKEIAVKTGIPYKKIKKLFACEDTLTFQHMAKFQRGLYIKFTTPAFPVQNLKNPVLQELRFALFTKDTVLPAHPPEALCEPWSLFNQAFESIDAAEDYIKQMADKRNHAIAFQIVDLIQLRAVSEGVAEPHAAKVTNRIA